MVTIEFDKVLTAEQLLGVKKYSFSGLINGEDSGGLYFLYNQENRLLYVGWTSYLNERIREHIKGKSSNIERFHKEIYMLKILYSSSFDDFFKLNPDCNDIEYYLIEKLDPKYNIKRSKKKAYT